MGQVTHEFPSERSLQFLARVPDLKYVVYRSSIAPDFNAENFELSLKKHSQHLSLVRKDSAGNYLLKLHPEVHARHLTIYLSPNLQEERIINLEYCFRGETQPHRIHLNVKTGLVPRADDPSLWKPAKEGEQPY